MYNSGPLAYPPTPTATSGSKSFTIEFALFKLLINLRGNDKLSRLNSRLIPAIGNPIIMNPAAGTFSISILPSAPTNNISISLFTAFNALAMAMAGKMCPPVPPPLITTRMF